VGSGRKIGEGGRRSKDRAQGGWGGGAREGSMELQPLGVTQSVSS
jgi:hypothetical protein